jgi:hypothetical protein
MDKMMQCERLKKGYNASMSLGHDGSGGSGLDVRAKIITTHLASFLSFLYYFVIIFVQKIRNSIVIQIRF